MKRLNKISAKIFGRLVEGLEHPGDSRTWDSDRGYMPLHVDFVCRLPQGPVLSLAHYYQQNGDSMKDPDMTFLVSTAGVYPLTFEQDGGFAVYHRAAWVNEAGELRFKARMQRDITSFANQWLMNLRSQQDIGRKTRQCVAVGA